MIFLELFYFAGFRWLSLAFAGFRWLSLMDIQSDKPHTSNGKKLFAVSESRQLITKAEPNEHAGIPKKKMSQVKDTDRIALARNDNTRWSLQ